MGFYINSVADSNLVFDSDFSPKNAIFTNSSSLTTTETKIKPTASLANSFDYFGFSVAVGSGRIVVGSSYDDDNGSDSGSAYIYNIGPGKDIDYSEYIEDVLSGVITQHTRL